MGLLGSIDFEEGMCRSVDCCSKGYDTYRSLENEF